jgi:hypothetical protein
MPRGLSVRFFGDFLLAVKESRKPSRRSGGILLPLEKRKSSLLESEPPSCGSGIPSFDSESKTQVKGY